MIDLNTLLFVEHDSIQPSVQFSAENFKVRRVTHKRIGILDYTYARLDPVFEDTYFEFVQVAIQHGYTTPPVIAGYAFESQGDYFDNAVSKDVPIQFHYYRYPLQTNNLYVPDQTHGPRKTLIPMTNAIGDKNWIEDFKQMLDACRSSDQISLYSTIWVQLLWRYTLASLINLEESRNIHHVATSLAKSLTQYKPSYLNTDPTPSQINNIFGDYAIYAHDLSKLYSKDL